MGCQLNFKTATLFLVFVTSLALSSAGQAAVRDKHTVAVKSCLKSGWKPLNVKVAGRERAVLWKRPWSRWKKGAIVVLHGGGGSHHQFCAGGRILKPQIAFAQQAVDEGFAVFLLDSTDGLVVDKKGNNCGKRFDFPVLNRRNLDLHFIGKMVKTIIPQLRPGRSSKKIFLTGLSTGGYMAIRAATHFNSKITAFAPVAAGDPYATRMDCDATLSKRKSAKGILLDIDTHKSITKKGACRSSAYLNEKAWPKTRSRAKPVFKQFHHKDDAIVDFSCMQKVKKQLQKHGYASKGQFVLKSGRRKVRNHLWLEAYNDAILKFFKSQ